MTRPNRRLCSIAALTLASGLALEAGRQTAAFLNTVDAIPRDAGGAFVGDLSKEDFVVREAGVPQEVATLVVSRGGRIDGQAAPGRILLFLVDDLHLDFVDTGRLRDLLKRLQIALVHEGDTIAAISTGPSGFAFDLTYDRTRLDEAIRRSSGSGLAPVDIIASAERGTEVRTRARIAIATAIAPIAALEGLRERRKTVIYLSNGYDAASAGELAALPRAANLANAAIYTFDAREVLAPAGVARPVDSPALAAHRRATLDSLRMLSEQTGGFTVLTRESVDEALARIDAETGDYYVIGYSAKRGDGVTRPVPLEITVRRPGVDVRHRPSTAR